MRRASPDRLNTGAKGLIFAILNIIYGFGYIGFYIVANFISTDVHSNSMLIFFNNWAYFKPIITIFALLISVLGLTNIIFTLLFWLVIFGILAGTIGSGFILLNDFIQCNTRHSVFPLNLCNDQLFCCVFHDGVTGCAGLGPCNLTAFPDSPTVKNDLIINPDFKLYSKFIIFFVIIELLIMIFAYMVYQVRLRAKRKIQLEQKEYTEYKYGPKPLKPTHVTLLKTEIKNKKDEFNLWMKKNIGNDHKYKTLRYIWNIIKFNISNIVDEILENIESEE